MASIPPQQSGKAPSIQDLITNTKTLINKLNVDGNAQDPANQAPTDSTVLTVEESVLLHNFIDNLDLHAVPGHDQRTELDRLAVKLWNIILTPILPLSNKLTCLLKALTAKILLICYNGQNTSGLSRMCKVIIRAATACLDEEYTALAKALLESYASYEKDLQHSERKKTSGVGGRIEYNIHGNYLLARLRLACKDNQIFEANMWYGKLYEDRQALDTTTYCNLCTALLLISNAYVDQENWQHACIWLQNTADLVDESDPLIAGKDFDGKFEMEISVLSTLVKISSRDMPPPGVTLRQALMARLSKTRPTSKAFLLTQLEYYTKPEMLQEASRNTSSDVPTIIEEALKDLTRYSILTQSILDTIIYYTHKLSMLRPEKAFLMLKLHLLPRLEDENQEWIEKTLTMMIYFHGKANTSFPGSKDFDLSLVLEECYAMLGRPISADYANACLMGVSMGLRNAEQQKDHQAIYKWCLIGLRPIFGLVDDENKAKLSRKIMQYWIIQKKHLPASNVADTMVESGRMTPETQFLLFQSAMQNGSSDAAETALLNIMKSEIKDMNMIFACINEARQSKRPEYFLSMVLRNVLTPFNQTIKAVGTPALYRLAVMHVEAQEKGQPILSRSKQVDWLCKIYAKACEQASQSQAEQPGLWTSEELEWFAGSVWNLTVEHLNDWPDAAVSSLTQSSMKFMSALLKEVSQTSILIKRYLLAIFLDCAYTLILARQYIDKQKQTQYLEQVLLKTGDFIDHHREVENALEQQDSNEVQAKSLAAVGFAFEAAVKLQKWDRATQLLKFTERQDGRYLEFNNQAVMADILLSAKDCPANTRVHLLQQILNNCWKIDPNVPKLSRWLRCLFSLTISPNETGRPMNHASAAEILEKAHAIAQQYGGQYPEEEMRYLAIHAFNQAVDFFSSGEKGLWEKWATLAMKLAENVGDPGLKNILEVNIRETQQQAQ